MSSPGPGAFAWFPPTLSVTDDEFTIAAQGCFVVFRYLTRPRPHIATLCGPAGRNLLEDSPVDHLHHRGVWWGHGDVNGVDYYLELAGGDGLPDRGAIEHLRWRSITEEGRRFALVEELAWRDHRGEVVLTEQRSVAVDLAAGDRYTVDLDSCYTAMVDIAFGDTKEAALPGIRVAEALTSAGGAAMTNARGQAGEAATFGQPAEWLDVSSPRSLIYLGAALTEGIACFDHPENPGYPNRWFTRGYGPVSPFPGHHFHPDRELAQGAQLRLRHRLLIHAGNAEEAGVAAAAAEYGAP